MTLLQAGRTCNIRSVQFYMLWLWVFMSNSISVTSNTLRFVLSGPGLRGHQDKPCRMHGAGRAWKEGPTLLMDGSLNLFSLWNTMSPSPQLALTDFIAHNFPVPLCVDALAQDGLPEALMATKPCVPWTMHRF